MKMSKGKNKKKKIIFLFFIAIILLGLLVVYSFTIYRHNSNDFGTNFVSIPIPIGAYSSYDVEHQPNGIIDENKNDKLTFDNPNHYLAQLIWFGEDGFLEYKVKNPLPKNSQVKTLRLFFEACSKAERYSLDHKTDISIYINGKKIGTHTIDSDFGGKRGKYTPEWWPTTNTQYGKPIFIEIRNDATYIGDNYNLDWITKKKTNINFQKVSDVGIKELNLNQSFITIRIGVDKDAQHRGGMNIFGEKFGNYPQTLTLGLEYDGEKIYQPMILDIINNPEKYENKTVIIAVHPGGWVCPPKKSTPLPEGFSRSATMIYDDTGCLYGDGDILVGKVLSPETHTIATPGNETIVIKGKVKLDKNKIPFISPLNEN